MAKSIKQTIEQNKRTSESYQKFKGELLAANEPIINKDMLLFKLDKV